MVAMSKRGSCSQCGKTFRARACGFSHAAIQSGVTEVARTGPFELGARFERLRIRRAQRDALILLQALFHIDDGATRIKRIYRTIDKATRATRKKGRRM